MAQPAFTLADSSTHREALLAINVEYMYWVADGIEKTFGISTIDLLGMSVEAYVDSMITKVAGDAPPRGVFYLIEHDGELAAIGGLRWVRDGIAEIKRVYVRPTHRGKHLGEAILRRLMDDAAAFGYRSIVLDSAPFMHSAQRLYASLGFVDRPPYPETEVPSTLHHDWRFMERAL